MKLRLQAFTSRFSDASGGMRNALAVGFDPWRARWQLLDTRLQRMVLVGGGALLLALLWAYIWLPASRGRAQLAERIPVMSAQLAAMLVQAEEIRRINSLPPVVTTRALLPLADVAALQTLFGANAKVTLDENRAFRITIPAIAYTAWLDQLDSALRRYRLRVAAINLKTVTVEPAEKSGQAAAKTVAAAPAGLPAKRSAAGAAGAEVAVELTLTDDSDRRP